MKSIKLLLIFISSSFYVLTVQGQCVMPANHDSFSQCNMDMANTFAPNIVQFTLSSWGDRFVKANFDGDFIGGNNWEHAPQAGNAPLNIYYSVIWSNTHCFITYSLFYPKDYSNCPDDEHENDLERILMTVRRATSTSPARLEEMKTTAHGHISVRTFCGETTTPTVYSSAGSHALYVDFWNAAYDTQSIISGLCGTNTFNTITFTPSSYGLTDVHNDGIDGLWKQRNNKWLFRTGGQQFVCTAGGGCGGFLTSNAYASAPWKSDIGSNPTALSFNLCGNGPGSEVYNEYECNYTISASKTTVCQNQNVTFTLNRQGGLGLNTTNVNWSYNTSKFQCVFGCGSNNTSITLKALSNYSYQAYVSATANVIDCGQVTASKTIGMGKPGIVNINPKSYPICGGEAVNTITVDDFSNYNTTNITWSAPFNVELFPYNNGKSFNLITGMTSGQITLNYTAYNACGSRSGYMYVNIEACEGIDIIIRSVESEIEELSITDYSLRNYPNPFSERTTIAYELPKDGPVTVFITNLMGQQVAVLEDNINKRKGAYQIEFDATNYSPGIYYYTLVSNDYKETKKMKITK